MEVKLRSKVFLRHKGASLIPLVDLRGNLRIQKYGPRLLNQQVQVELFPNLKVEGNKVYT